MLINSSMSEQVAWSQRWDTGKYTVMQERVPFNFPMKSVYLKCMYCVTFKKIDFFLMEVAYSNGSRTSLWGIYMAATEGSRSNILSTAWMHEREDI